MACQITISSVNAYGSSGQSVGSVEVKGSAVECSAVVVTINCGGTAKTQTVAVGADSLWTALFSDTSGTGCVCNDPNVALRVTAACKADPNCLDTKTIIPIPCQPYPCPTVDHIETQVPNCAQVMQDDGWNVTFNAVINGGGVTNYAWSFGDQQNMSGPGLQQVTHKYVCAGSYVVTLVIVSDCEPGYVDIYTMELELSPCGCPQVNSITAQPDAENPCKIKFQAKIAAPFQQCIEDYLWNFGDGTDPEFQTQDVEHVYEYDGTYDVTLTLLGGIGEPDGGSCSTTIQVTVSGCRERNGNGNGNGNGTPCKPWWHPKCWKWCQILAWFAMSLIIAGSITLMIAACKNSILVSVIGAAVMAAGLGALLLWYNRCSGSKVDFCKTLQKFIQLITWIMYIQALVAIVGGAVSAKFGNLPCAIGLVAGFAYYAYVLNVLKDIREWADCPH